MGTKNEKKNLLIKKKYMLKDNTNNTFQMMAAQSLDDEAKHSPL